MQKVNLADAFSQITEHWSPRIAAELNSQYVKLTRVQGTFDWHHHAEADELFFVVKGRLRIELNHHRLEVGGFGIRLKVG